jgi:beta-lactamase superfamily II metal-dependent hydrolase
MYCVNRFRTPSIIALLVVIALILDGASNTNNNSVVTVLEASGHKMLVTGDAEDEKSKKVRTALLGRLQTENLYPIDVYVVGHHGSETSSSAGLLSLIRPTFAVISNEGPSGQYENPDITVMKRLSAAGATVFSTYRSGDVVIEFGRDGIALSPPDRDSGDDLITSTQRMPVHGTQPRPRRKAVVGR